MDSKEPLMLVLLVFYEGQDFSFNDKMLFESGFKMFGFFHKNFARLKPHNDENP